MPELYLSVPVVLYRCSRDSLVHDLYTRHPHKLNGTRKNTEMSSVFTFSMGFDALMLDSFSSSSLINRNSNSK